MATLCSRDKGVSYVYVACRALEAGVCTVRVCVCVRVHVLLWLSL